MDITSFMEWFVSQAVSIFTFTYTTLNNITFGGTSLLKVIIFLNVIVPFLYIIITIPMGAGSIAADKAKVISEYNNNVKYANLNERLAMYNDGDRNFHLNEWATTRKKLKKSRLYRE